MKCTPPTISTPSAKSEDACRWTVLNSNHSARALATQGFQSELCTDQKIFPQPVWKFDMGFMQLSLFNAAHPSASAVANCKLQAAQSSPGPSANF
jgi:hypothetical protein